MSFRDFIESKYQIACRSQHEMTKDVRMIEMLRSGPQDIELIKSWMLHYRLFQGITSQNRDAIAKQFLRFSKKSMRIESALGNPEIRDLYTELFTALYRTVERSWLSATSKLLWCLYPHDIVIYDAFVHRTLTVMQHIDADLISGKFDPIDQPPRIESGTKIVDSVAHYMNYQAILRHLLCVHSGRLQELRARHGEKYPYDIRILDKLLWMIGNPRKSY